MKINIKEMLVFLVFIASVTFSEEILQVIITAGELCAGYFR